MAKAEVDFSPQKRKKPESADYTEADIAHPELFQALKEWRTAKAKELELAPYQVVHQRVAVQIAVTLPQTLAELEKIRGVGAKTVAKFGYELVDMVVAYRRRHGIEQVVLPEKPKSAEKQQPGRAGQAGETRRITLEMFRKGHSLEQIAAARGLAQSTIESHLSTLVQQGELGIDELLSGDRQKAIEQAIASAEGNSLREIKEVLGEEISYGQIKIVLAHQGILVR
ncbi:MAG: helix-turn-helix domain-containing protein [Desulfovermiculus sp.]